MNSSRRIIRLSGNNCYRNLRTEVYANSLTLNPRILTQGIKTIDIKNNKGEQAIRIPKKMRIDDDKVYLKKVSNSLYIIPYHSPWQNLIESTDSFTSDFMNERNQPVQQLRESLD